jgi:hypothetical protein
MKEDLLIFDENDISLILHDIGRIIREDIGNLDTNKYTSLLNKVKVNYKDQQIQDYANYLLREFAKHKDFSNITF